MSGMFCSIVLFVIIDSSRNGAWIRSGTNRRHRSENVELIREGYVCVKRQKRLRGIYYQFRNFRLCRRIFQFG
jgi:hypothetical protein